MKTFLTISSGITLLGVSSVLGFMARPAEMGLAVVAGALGLAFANIDKISKFKGAGFEAEMREQVQAIIDKETEQNSIGSSVSEIPELPEKALKALSNTKYTWRSIVGLMKAANLTRPQVSEAMSWLVENGYARHSLGKPGSIWTLTPEGRQLSAAVLESRDASVAA